MTGDVDFAGGGVEATVSPKVRGIAEEDAANGAGMEFVGSGCGGVWVTGTPENAEMVIGGVAEI